jgi:septal ring factor EnvC (AmiA/AmiB activator)
LETIQFDTLGRAVVNSLRQGEPTQFAVGDFALFDQETAEQLTRDGLVEKVELVYVRQLRDYATYFHEFQRRMDVLQERIDAVQADTQSLVNAKAKAEQQLAYRTDEKAKLAQDLANFTMDRDEVAKFIVQLEQQRQQTRDKLSELYRANYQLAEELARLQKEMLDKINQRSADAMAQAIP